MRMSDALAAGRFGLTFELPEHLVIDQDDDITLVAVDEARQIMWYLFFFADLHLDVQSAQRAHLEHGLPGHARFIFDNAFHTQPPEERPDEPRTADVSWSPMIDVAYPCIDDVDALRTVHRMFYQPGREIIMGHVMIPVRDGLFEARTVAIDRTTGYRESTLMMTRLSGKDDDLSEVAARVQQADYDDPGHDDDFPEHSLTRTRRALDWLCTEAGLRIATPPRSQADEHVELAELGIALRPPPRFVQDADSQNSFHRVAFCGTDGIDRLFVDRADDGFSADGDLRSRTLALARRIHEDAEVEHIEVTFDSRPALDGRPVVLVLVEGQGHQGSLRNGLLWLFDEHTRPWHISLISTSATPGAQIAEELDAIARSWRVTRAPARRPWWKFW